MSTMRYRHLSDDVTSSMTRRNFNYSWCRCGSSHMLIAAPLSVLIAANRVTVPLAVVLRSAEGVRQAFADQFHYSAIYIKPTGAIQR